MSKLGSFPHPSLMEYDFIERDLQERNNVPLSHLRPPTPPQPSFTNPFGLPPYFAQFLPSAASAAAIVSAANSASSDAESVADSNSDSTGSPVAAVTSAAALDLSPKSVNVGDSVEDWSVEQVVAFVRGVDGCEEYAEVISTADTLKSSVAAEAAKRSTRVQQLGRLVTPLPQRAVAVFPGI